MWIYLFLLCALSIFALYFEAMLLLAYTYLNLLPSQWRRPFIVIKYSWLWWCFSTLVTIFPDVFLIAFLVCIGYLFYGIDIPQKAILTSNSWLIFSSFTLISLFAYFIYCSLSFMTIAVCSCKTYDSNLFYECVRKEGVCSTRLVN